MGEQTWFMEFTNQLITGGPHLFGYCMLLHKILRSGGLAKKIPSFWWIDRIDLRKMEPEHMKSKNHSALLAIETSQLFPSVKITLFFGVLKLLEVAEFDLTLESSGSCHDFWHRFIFLDAGNLCCLLLDCEHSNFLVDCVSVLRTSRRVGSRLKALSAPRKIVIEDCETSKAMPYKELWFRVIPRVQESWAPFSSLHLVDAFEARPQCKSFFLILAKKHT